MKHPKRSTHDGIIAVAIFFAGAVIAFVFMSWTNVHPKFYQEEFAPAVMLACGKGYVAVTLGPDTSALSDFLNLKTDSFSCEETPDGASTELDLFQKGHVYLIGAVGLLWKFTGVAWGNLAPLYGLLYGLAAVASYGIFRLGAGRSIAVGATLVLIFSTLQLDNLPHLRDYAKAPFILVVVLFMGWMVRYRMTNRQLLTLAAATGAVLGVSIGFRMDLFIFLPVVLATLCLFTPGHPLGNVRTKAAAVFLFVLTFLATGWPVLQAFGGGGNTFHVILLGSMSPFDSALGIRPSIYEWGYLYNDIYINNILNSFVHRADQTEQVLRLATREYEEAGLRYYWLLLSNFPADFLVRYFAAVIKTLELTRPEFLVYGLPRLFYSPLALVAAVMPWLVFLILGAISTKSIRHALFASLLILFLAGYPSLQFHGRHVFHLQFVSLWVIAFLLHRCVSFIISWRESRLAGVVSHGGSWPVASNYRLAFKRWMIFSIGSLALMFGSLWSLRAWQQMHLTQFLNSYQLATAQAIVLSPKIEPSGDMLFPLPESSRYKATFAFPFDTRYWVAEFDGARCERDNITLTVVYDASDPFFDASRSVELNIFPASQYFFPTYDVPQTGFAALVAFSVDITDYRKLVGIRLADEDASCLTGIKQVTDTARFPLLLNLLLTPGWRQESLYQRIGDPADKRVVRHTPEIFRFPHDLSLGNSTVKQMVHDLPGVALASATFRAATVSAQEGELRVNGEVASAYSYLVQLPLHRVATHDYFIAEGELGDGGITLGLLKDNKWSGQINITEPGKFRAVIRADAGEFVATLANNVPTRKTNHFRITKMGWAGSVAFESKSKPNQ